MATYECTIMVLRKKDVLDPEAVAIQKALQTTMGYPEVQKVYCGKRYVVELESTSEHDARKKTDEMTHKLFANPIIETHEVQIKEKAP